MYVSVLYSGAYMFRVFFRGNPAAPQQGDTLVYSRLAVFHSVFEIKRFFLYVCLQYLTNDILRQIYVNFFSLIKASTYITLVVNNMTKYIRANLQKPLHNYYEQGW